MKKIIFILTAIFVPLCLMSADGGRENYCPLGINQNWVYSLFSKKDNVQKDDIHTFIKTIEKFDGTDCYFYEAPSKSIYVYFITGVTGIYAKAVRTNLPVLGFINVDIVFDPPGLLLKSEIKDGDKWRYEGKAVLKTLAIINIETKVSADIKMIGMENITVHGRKFKAYHAEATASRNWNDETPMKFDCWLVKNVGLVKGETKNSLLEIKECYTE